MGAGGVGRGRGGGGGEARGGGWGEGVGGGGGGTERSSYQPSFYLPTALGYMYLGGLSPIFPYHNFSRVEDKTIAHRPQQYSAA